jgi:hypothetical protein
MLKVAESTHESGPVDVMPRRRPMRRVALVTLVCLAVLCAVGGGLYWKATRSSISLDYLSDRVQSTIAQRLPDGAMVDVGSTAFSYNSDEGVILRIRDLELLLPGTARVSVAELSTVTTPAALMGSRIDLDSVTISGVRIGVVTASTAAKPQGSGADFLRHAASSFMDQVIEADDLMRDAGLEEVVVRDADIHLDEATGPGSTLQIGEANWLPLSETRSKAWMQIIDAGGDGWDLTLERRATPLGNSVVQLEFEDVPVAALVPQLSRTDGGPYFHSTITLQTRMAKTKDGRFRGVRGILSAADGELSFTGEDEIHISKAAVSFVLDETGDRMGIPSGEIRTLTGGLTFEGVADLAALDQMTLVGNIRRGSFSTPIGETDTVEVTGGGGVARVNFADLGIDVERLEIKTPNGSASAIGQASLAGDTPGLSFALSMTEVPVAAVRALWPPFVADKLRDWFDVNVKSGTLGPATLQVALPPDHIGPSNRGKVLPRYALVGSLPFRDAAFTPISSFPTITKASGEISFGNATATIVAQSGIMTRGGRGTLQAAGTTLVIPELGRLQPRGDLHLEVSGSAAALAIMSNTPPLSIASERGIVADNLSGEAALSLDANIPLHDSDFSGVIPNFRLELTDFSSTSPIDDRTVENADLVLEGNPRSYTVKGEGTLDGYQVSVDVIQGSAAPDQSAVTVELDDAARKRMGLGFGKLVTGPVSAYLMNTGELGQQVALDLKQTRISLPFLGWEKGPGVPATASFVMTKTNDETKLSKFLLSGKGFEARGDLTIGSNGRLKEMTLERLALRAGDQLSATVTANGGGYDVQVKGGVLDARGIVQGFGSGQIGGGADIFPVRVSLNLDVVRGENDVSLTGVAGKMTINRKGLDTASIKGSSNSSQPFEWTLTRDGDARTLRLFANDGGALIGFAGIYSRVAGGNLVLDYSGTVGGGGNGVMLMRDFRVVNETAFRQVFEPSSPRAGMVHSNAQTGGAHVFNQLRIPFRQQGWVITIDEAALRGAALGATASGTVNVPDAKMAISGTLIPAFGLNNIAGSIPVLGAILGGGRDEGLVGITYKLFGPLDNPELVLNPISAIAPGIFRKIFEFR